MRLMDALEDRGDHVAPVAAVGALRGAQIGEQPGATCCRRAARLVVVDEGDQLVAGDPVRSRRPVPPAVGRLDGRAEVLAG